MIGSSVGWAIAHRILPSATLAVAVAGLMAAPVAAAGACRYTIAGGDLDAAGTPERAIEVPYGEEIVVAATGPAPLGQVSIQAQFWPVVVPVSQPPPTNDSSWTGSVNLADQVVSVQGLYEIRVDEDIAECPPSRGWVRIAGGNPFVTVPGAVGAGVAVIGLALLFASLRAAAGAGRGGIALGGIGGAMAGAGALVVAQQAGVTPLDVKSLGLWAGVPGIGGSVLNRVVAALGGRQVAGRVATGGRAPTRAPPEPTYAEPHPTSAPPPMTTAEPPPAAAPEPELSSAAEPTAGSAPPGADMASAPPPADTGAGAGATSGEEPEPPRVSYAWLDAPDAVVAEVPFDISVGLSGEPDTELDAAPLVLPPWTRGPYTLTVQLLADGFTRVDGGADPWRIDLPVTGAAPYPVVVVRLSAEAAGGPVRGRQIRATYSVDGQVMGTAMRQIAVVDDAARLADVEPPEPKASATLSTPRGEDAPDLTITIDHREGQEGGRFSLQMLTRDGVGIRPPSNALPIDLGPDPLGFLRGVIDSVHAVESTAALRLELLGIGHRIEQQLPRQLWDVLGQIITAVAPAPPSIQILSAEAHVPWELAVIPNDVPLADQNAPRFLGAQAVVGRWVLGDPPPRIPPPGRLDVHSIGVVSGVFAGSDRLAQAEAEAEALESTFDAIPIQAADAEVIAGLTQQQPPFDVFHFAVHGDFSAGDTEGTAGPIRPRILFADGTSLSENAIRGLEPLPGTPFVFLNACQLGSGHQVLGDYAGMAAAFLYSGAAGVVAPLWSVDDDDARRIALQFYERVFAGASPAEALRLERASFLSSPETASSTVLAYQYYGHPALKLERVEEPHP